ncbi:MAG TPA: hypothetical protein VLE49_19600 [Anaerolineales bacterium]|nr:hypothetical protein [Anaerolineales bacterium]
MIRFPYPGVRSDFYLIFDLTWKAAGRNYFDDPHRGIVDEYNRTRLDDGTDLIWSANK